MGSDTTARPVQMRAEWHLIPRRKGDHLPCRQHPSTHVFGHQFADLPEGLENPITLSSACGKGRGLQTSIQVALHDLQRENGYAAGIQVPFVALHDQGDLPNAEPHLFETTDQVLEALHVLFPPDLQGIGHEHNPVNARENNLSGGIELYLTRDGIELDPNAETPNLSEIQGQEIEEQGLVALGIDADHFPPGATVDPGIDVLEVCRLSTAAGAIIDHLALDLPCCKIGERHGFPSCSIGTRGILKRPDMSIRRTADPRQSQGLTHDGIFPRSSCGRPHGDVAPGPDVL